MTVEWTDHAKGFVAGLFHLPISAISWLLYCLPLNCLVLLLYRWKKWQRFRSFWILMPSISVLTISAASLLHSPPTAEGRFLQTTGISLPEQREATHWHFSGGGLADYFDVYYFRTRPGEVQRLIQELKLEQVDNPRGTFNSNSFKAIQKKWGTPNPFDWENFSLYYSTSGERQEWHHCLMTTEDQTGVYVIVGCI